MPDVTLKLKAENADLKAKLAESTAAVAKLTAEINKLKAEGSGTGKLEADLGKVKDAAYNAERALAANRAELAKQKQAQLDAANAAKAGAGALGTIVGAAATAGKAFGVVGLALATFKKSFTETRNIIKFFRDQFGIDIDAMVTKSLGLETIAERMAGLGDSQKNAALDSERLRNQINVLDNLAIKHNGTVADVNAKYEAWVASHRKVVESTEATNASFEKFQKTVTGFSLDELNAEIGELVGLGAKLQAEGKFEEGPFAEAFKARVDKATAALEALGTKGVSADLLAKFTNLADQTRLTAEATDQLAKSQQQLAKDAEAVVTSLTKQIESLDKTRNAIDDLSTDANDGLSRLIGQFEELSEAQDPKRATDYRVQIEGLTEEYDELGASLIQSTETEERRAEILAEIKTLQAEASRVTVAGIKEQITAQADFARLLGDYEQQIRQLPEEVRPALQALVDRFQFANEQVSLGVRDIQEFKTAWVSNLGIAGATIDGFKDRTVAALGDATDAAMNTAEAIGMAFDSAGAHIDTFNGKLATTKTLLAEIQAGVPSVAVAVEEAF